MDERDFARFYLAARLAEVSVKPCGRRIRLADKKHAGEAGQARCLLYDRLGRIALNAERRDCQHDGFDRGTIAIVILRLEFDGAQNRGHEFSPAGSLRRGSR